MLRLCDVWAQPWGLNFGETRYEFKPLSLNTFAQAELRGLTLTKLAGQGDKVLEAWLLLFMFLAEIENTPANLEELLAVILTSPNEWEMFQHTVGSTFSDGSDAASPGKQVQTGQRRVKQWKPPKQDSEDEQDEPDQADYSFLVLVSRMSGISLADLSRMTFRGLLSVQKSLEEMPPQPAMGGLLG